VSLCLFLHFGGPLPTTTALLLLYYSLLLTLRDLATSSLLLSGQVLHLFLHFCVSMCNCVLVKKVNWVVKRETRNHLSSLHISRNLTWCSVVISLDVSPCVFLDMLVRVRVSVTTRTLSCFWHSQTHTLTHTPSSHPSLTLCCTGWYPHHLEIMPARSVGIKSILILRNQLKFEIFEYLKLDILVPASEVGKTGRDAAARCCYRCMPLCGQSTPRHTRPKPLSFKQAQAR